MKSRSADNCETSYPLSILSLPAATAADNINLSLVGPSTSSLIAWRNSWTNIVNFCLSSGRPPLSAGNSQSYTFNNCNNLFIHIILNKYPNQLHRNQSDVKISWHDK